MNTDELAKRFIDVSYMELLDIHFERLEDGEAVCTMTVDQRHLRAKQIAHGGALASLLDCAMGGASMSVMPEGHDSTTMQLNVHYMRAARVGDRLTATAHVLHGGKRTCVTEAQITDAEGRRVASATSTLMYLQIRPPA